MTILNGNLCEQNVSLLVVDMWWENEIKNKERGHIISFNDLTCRYEERKGQYQDLQYPGGSIRAGLDAIHDVVRAAHRLNKKIYAVIDDDGRSPADEVLDKTLLPHISNENIFNKYDYSAFTSTKLIKVLQDDPFSYLMILGFDRDCCVLETIKDATERGIKVVTSEMLMLTTGRKDGSIAREYFRKNTTYLESLVEVYNFLDPKGRLVFNP